MEYKYLKTLLGNPAPFLKSHPQNNLKDNIKYYAWSSYIGIKLLSKRKLRVQVNGNLPVNGKI